MKSNFFVELGQVFGDVEVYYFVYWTLHGTKHVMVLSDIATDNSEQLYFKSIWCGYSKKKKEKQSYKFMEEFDSTDKELKALFDQYPHRLQ